MRYSILLAALLWLGCDSVSEPNTPQSGSSQIEAIHLRLTGLVANIEHQVWDDTLVQLDTLPTLQMTLQNSRCGTSGDTVFFCIDTTVMGSGCNCTADLLGSGFIVLDTTNRLIKQFSLSWDSLTNAPRWWKSAFTLEIENLPYGADPLPTNLDIEAAQLAESLKSVTYHYYYHTTAAGASYDDVARSFEQVLPDARLVATIVWRD
jgi:hypothetical protein